MSGDTQVGPVTNLPQLEKITGYIDIAKREGATCLLGGKRPEAHELENGWFVEPTIFSNVQNSMRVAQEEIFGDRKSVVWGKSGSVRVDQGGCGKIKKKT